MISFENKSIKSVKLKIKQKIRKKEKATSKTLTWTCDKSVTLRFTQKSKTLKKDIS